MTTIFFPPDRGWAYAKHWCQERGILVDITKENYTGSVNYWITVRKPHNRRMKSPLMSIMLLGAILSERK